VSTGEHSTAQHSTAQQVYAARQNGGRQEEQPNSVLSTRSQPGQEREHHIQPKAVASKAVEATVSRLYSRTASRQARAVARKPVVGRLVLVMARFWPPCNFKLSVRQVDICGGPGMAKWSTLLLPVLSLLYGCTVSAGAKMPPQCCCQVLSQCTVKGSHFTESGPV
jgi:hypothetical protein